MADRLLLGAGEPLVVAACERRAAAYACRRWHYSGTMPAGKLVTYGAWEFGEFAGAVVFGRGSTPKIGQFVDVEDQTEVAELVRVALTDHDAPVSQIVARAVSLLRSSNPGLRLLVSFADADQGHHGGIYQAMNWTYTGAMRSWTLEVDGRRLHPRTANRRFGTCSADLLVERGVDAVRVDLPPKHRYALGLDRRMRRRLAEVALRYPRPAVEVSDGETPPFHGGGVGSIPADRSDHAASS